MKIALIQLSDIHIRCDINLKVNSVENPILQRSGAVAKAVNSVCRGVQHGIIVLSGDTAFSGKEGEYQQGHALVEGIRSGVQTSFGDPVAVLLVAGNHDCDFKIATSVRGIVLDSLKPEKIDDAIITECVGVQGHYDAFADKFDPPPVDALTTGVDRIYRQRVIQLGGKTVVFHLLNSAWSSQLHEKPGSLYYPLRLIKDRIAAAPQADIVVAVVHHPFNWYWPDNGRELRKLLEDHADLILTGHEHVPGAYGKRTDAGEQNEYLEGGVLQESGQPDISSFNLVLFDTAQGQQQTYRFVWKGDHYAPEGEPYWRPFERNKRLTRNQFEFAPQFFQWLDDPGAGYTHPHKDPLTLTDLFVYPDLQEVQYQRDAADRPLVRSRDVVSYVLNNKRTLFLAEEKAGKTSLAKALLKDLCHNGKIGVLLNGETLSKVSDGDRLKKAVNAQLDEQYGSGHADRFWQLESGQRAAIVDDFHKVSGNRKSKDRLVALLREWFDIFVMLAGEEFRVEELAVPAAGQSALWDFKQCSVLQFGHARRHELVSKWCRLGREYTDEEPDIDREVKRAEDQISTVISIDFLPSFPVFILILLQQLESTTKLTTTSGSFGYLYEVLVTASLARRKALRDELDAMHTYLSEFAYHLFTGRKRALPEGEVRSWHQAHCKEYRLPLMYFAPLWDELVASGVIDSRHGEYKFRYKYLYYFFVARYFRDNINKPEILGHIGDLSRRLYHERSANIMIFLCHLSKDERVLTAMLDAARGLFPNATRFDVSKQGEFLNRMGAELLKLVLEAGDPVENRKRMLEARDQQERKSAETKEESDPVEEEPAGREIDDIMLFNAAFKTIQILGQVLKNFSGSLKGTPKRQLVEECYGLGLRVLGTIFNLAEMGFPDLVEIFVQQAKTKADDQPIGQVEECVRRLFFGLLQMVAYSVFKHVSDSVGTEKVAQTFDEVVADEDNPSVRVIDLSIRLDHYNRFPESQINQLAKLFAGNVFAMNLVRYLVWYHLYLFTVDYKQRQFACEKLGIAIENQTKLLAPSVKKTPAKRSGKGKKKSGRKDV